MLWTLEKYMFPFGLSQWCSFLLFKRSLSLWKRRDIFRCWRYLSSVPRELRGSWNQKEPETPVTCGVFRRRADGGKSCVLRCDYVSPSPKKICFLPVVMYETWKGKRCLFYFTGAQWFFFNMTGASMVYFCQMDLYQAICQIRFDFGFLPWAAGW